MEPSTDSKKINHIANLLAKYDIFCKQNYTDLVNKNRVRDEIMGEFKKAYKVIFADSNKILWNPDHIESQTLISGTVMSHCNEWGVNVKVISDIDFNYLKVLNRAFIHDINQYGIDVFGNKKIICFSENFNYKERNANTLALHELAHVLLKVKPNFIAEASSPLMALWSLLMKHCNLDHALFNDPNKLLSLKSMVKSEGAGSNIKFESIDDYINNFIPELKELGFIDQNNELTFKPNAFQIKHSWLSRVRAYF